MKIQNITIKNFRGIHPKEFSTSLDPKLTVFIGSNGIGKSTILDAISMVLSQVINQIRFRKNMGVKFKDTDIPPGRFDETILSIVSVYGNFWEMRKEKSSPKASITHNKEYIENIIAQIEATEEQCSIPLFVYYRINRAVLAIPLRIRKKHEFSLLEAYDEALLGGTNFKHFFEWFRNREDLENEIKNQEKNFDYSDKQLTAVRTAIESSMHNFSGLSVRRNPLRMIIKKGEQELRIDQLSDGEKCMLAMIGDLARRLAIANPTLDEPLHGEGIVLIDEVELHLHPAWQRMILGKLCEIFQNCQFIVTTHSPQALGEITYQHIRILEKDIENQLIARIPNQSLGLSSAEILEEIMDTPKRDEDISQKLDTIYSLIDNEDFDNAKFEIANLKIELNGSIPEIVRMEGLIAMLESDE